MAEFSNKILFKSIFIIDRQLAELTIYDNLLDP